MSRIVIKRWDTNEGRINQISRNETSTLSSTIVCIITNNGLQVVSERKSTEFVADNDHLISTNYWKIICDSCNKCQHCCSSCTVI